MRLRNYVNCKVTFRISQAKGFRYSNGGCTFEPFFIECRRALPGETRANGLGAGAPPVAALGIIGQVTGPSLKLVKSIFALNNK